MWRSEATVARITEIIAGKPLAGAAIVRVWNVPPDSVSVHVEAGCYQTYAVRDLVAAVLDEITRDELLAAARAGEPVVQRSH